MWQVVMWFGVGLALVQLCVANCSMVQLWFSIGTALLQLVVASWFSKLWPDVLWLSFGSALVQFVVV